MCARQIVIDAVRSSRYLYLGKPVTVLVSMKLAEKLGTVVELTAKAYVYDARHEKSFASDVTDRVLRAFRGAGVLMPTEGDSWRAGSPDLRDGSPASARQNR